MPHLGPQFFEFKVILYARGDEAVVYCAINTYHEDPCGSHGPRHTQQKSDLHDWFLHTIWLQPPSFSIVAPINIFCKKINHRQ